MKFFLAEKLPEELRQYLKLIQKSHRGTRHNS